ncbi:MAG: hypothetical protein IMY71_14140 [Bacteroidetes bacterium]|nr:hypothetical protein [Bacteroidota bacterium]
MNKTLANSKKGYTRPKKAAGQNREGFTYTDMYDSNKPAAKTKFTNNSIL